jgi:thiosulfate/3-mercaptopyruvate sulfurtransferase
MGRNRDAVLISAERLMNAESQAPAILDVRWRLDQPDGRVPYLAGHIPGAVYVSLEDELSDHTRPGLGRHPLPTGAALESAARRWGLRRHQPVVVYDDWNRAGSARAWWVLTAAGFDDVRILDGGLAAWTAAGGELQSGPVSPPAGDVTVVYEDLYAGGRPVRSADEIAGGAVTMVLDARAPERFRGEVEPVDPVAGHIPGARNLPSMAVLGPDGRFLPDDRLAALADESGVGPSVGVYCGSGVTASVVLAALNAIGLDGALFPGSWSQWSGEDRPVERGDWSAG